MATRVPQIHILNEEMSTRSKINAVRDSCQEARREFDMLELDYFQHSLDESQYEHSAVRCYVNLDLDTVWLSFAGAFICVPEEIPFHCGKCRGPMGTEVPGCHEYVFRGSFRQIKRLAINHLSWLEPEEFSDNGTMEILWRHKVEQLLIVVGDYIGLAKDRDVQFITPSQPLHHGMYGNGPILPGPNESWHEKEKDFVNEMEDFRTRRAAERKQMEDGIFSNFQAPADIANDDLFQMARIPIMTRISRTCKDWQTRKSWQRADLILVPIGEYLR